MNITELTEQVASSRNISKNEARETIDAVLQAIVNAAKSGSEISLPGFGKFKVQERAAREGRNPATGAIMKIPASRKLSFAPAKAVKDALNS